MKLGQLIEFLAIVSADSPNLIESASPLSSESLQRYDRWSQLRCTDWVSRLESLPREIAAAPAENRADIWQQAEPVLIDVLAGGLLARVWGSIITACDRTRRTLSAEKLARNIVTQHDTAQQQVLRLMVDGPYLTLERVVGLDRMRRRIERWTDLLAGHVIRRFGMAEFAYDIERAIDFGDEQLRNGESFREPVWDLYLVCLRSSFPDVLLPGGEQARWREEVLRSILYCLPSELFIDDGRLRSVRLQRLLNAGALPEGPPGAGTLPGILPGVLPAARQFKINRLGRSRLSNQDL